MKILLAGSQGQLGQSIIRTHLKKYFDLIHLTSCDKYQLDITDKLSVEKNIAQYSPDFIINAAAYTRVDQAESEQEKAFLINAKGCQNLAEICAEKNIFLISFSTDYIFDGAKNSSYIETDAPNPINIYGQTKWQGEQAIRQYGKNYLIFRISWVFSEYGANFVKTMLKLMQTRDTLKIVSDQTGCPTYAGHIAEMLFNIILCYNNNLPAGTYHYTGLSSVSWYEFAQNIYAQLLKTPHLRLKTAHILPVNTIDYPAAAKRGKNSILDSQLFEKTFDLALSDWKTGLEKTLKILIKTITHDKF